MVNDIDFNVLMAAAAGLAVTAALYALFACGRVHFAAIISLGFSLAVGAENFVGKPFNEFFKFLSALRTSVL